MAYSKAKLKAVVIKHPHVSDHFGQENYQTNVSLPTWTLLYASFNQPG
jgi:hypothetical protein